MKYVKSYRALNENLSLKSKSIIEKLAEKFIHDYVLNEFVNNRDGAAAFYELVENMHEKELGIKAEEIEDNYNEIEKIVKDCAKKLVSHK